MPEQFCICLDCDRTSTMDEHGQCTTCQSKSTLKQGAIKALRSYMGIVDIEEKVSTIDHRTYDSGLIGSEG